MRDIQRPVVQIFRSLQKACRSSLRLVPVVAFSVALSGCFFDTAQWSTIESPKHNSVEWIKFDHQVKFDEVGARLSRQERERLSRFLSNIQAGSRDDIVISANGTKGAVSDEALAARRISVVKALVEGAGLTTQATVPGRSATDWDGTIDIVVGRYVVIGPKCPDWTKPSGSDWTNQSSSNHGCATTTNLGLMLADPGDLVRTRPITPSDGQAGALKVDLYRKGAIATKAAPSAGGK